jgi:O-antigen ligase
LAARKKRIKAAFFVALAPILITLAFTDSRTAYVSVAAGIGVIIFSGIIGKTEKSEKFTRTNSWIKWLTAFGIMFLSFVIILYGMTLLTPALNQIKNQGVIPVAYAEGTGKANLSTRSFDDLSGRTDLWIEILNYIRSGWKIMLAGVSKVAPLQHFGAYYAHCHCLYIQVLLESGIPGLFLIIFFIIYTIIHSIRTIRLPDIPLWIRLLPALPISLWVGDLAECFTWLRSSQCMMIAVLFICAGIINAQQTNTKEQISKT